MSEGGWGWPQFPTLRWLVFWLRVAWDMRARDAATCLGRTPARCESMHGECRCVLDANHPRTLHVCTCEHRWRETHV
jgi:hypothetical protein